jgi:hypothetical protein
MAEPRPFDPEAILRALQEHEVEYVLIGGLAASLHGSPHVTTDVDVTPSRSPRNLERLARALTALGARVRSEDAPDGLPFDFTPRTLAQNAMLNLTTRHGDLGLAFEPAGTRGYDDLIRDALAIEIRDTRVVLAALADVIRSKEAAGREKDRLQLPTLRRLLERTSG